MTGNPGSLRYSDLVRSKLVHWEFGIMADALVEVAQVGSCDVGLRVASDS